MDCSVETTSTPAPAAVSVGKASFPAKLFEILNKVDENGDNQLLQWNPNGMGFSINAASLDDYLASSESIFEQRNVKNFLKQLSGHGFENVTSLEKMESCNGKMLFFQHDQFRRDEPALLPNIIRNGQQKPSKFFYCRTEPNYLKYKRANDPCHKLVPPVNEYDTARMHLRALLSKQKLKRIINARLANQQQQQSNLHEVYQDLLPNETNIAIQMGAIAGYYGETVVEDDLIRFFGKFLPMYKPISEVVDSITPSISNKIQSSNFIWRNAALGDEGAGGAPSITTTAEVHAADRPPIDPNNDITFEYVSFKDQTVNKKMAPPAMEKNNILTRRSAAIVEMALSKGAINQSGRRGGSGYMNVAGGLDHEEPIPIIDQQRDDFMTVVGSEEEEALKHINETSSSTYHHQNNGAAAHLDMPQFTNNLLDSNYYDEATVHEDDDGMYSELKNAIDLIMN